ncbi:hypothetical protein KDU71_02980 [Carboxylicivirga sediminis]|uniref:Outer membrane protein beta-barrel domain-containing protein n=1 Tax=Carboxylicivirga sediminis TaxID=2006564 RepID=A0A941IW82_9BACT|nr:hypothetical protein [Carboxylicivirga sediminis]MBR8534508.1 hypothetical protein [Carboxylicivirga sediminis]
MKKIKLLAVLCCVLTSAIAQNEEISITYSPASLYRFEKWVDGRSDGQAKYFVLGAFNLEYSRYLNKWLKLGINIMYDKTVSEGVQAYYYTPYPNINSPYRSSKSAFVVAPQLDFEYLRHPKFKLYSGLNIGYAKERIRNEGGLNSSADIDGLTVHLNLLGFRWGQKQGFTGNIGIGYKGLINLGYFIRF